MQFYFRCRKCHELIVIEEKIGESPKAPSHCGEKAQRIYYPLNVIYHDADFQSVAKRFDYNPIDEE